MVERLPPEVEAKYTKYVKLQDTLATVAQERSLLEATISELDEVLSRVSELPDDVELYKIVGHIMVRTSKNVLVDELKNKKEELEIRLKAVKTQEEYLKKEVDRLAGELRSLLGGRTAATGG
ncbi:MAG: prefoldin subunit beta [Acidilobaceae archaeon]